MLPFIPGFRRLWPGRGWSRPEPSPPPPAPEPAGPAGATATLHVLGQLRPNDSVVVVGTPEALRGLAAALLAATRDEFGMAEAAFRTADGEYFPLFITAAGDPEDWRDMALPWEVHAAAAPDDED